MKYIKLYEHIKKPQIGDYVIVNTDNVAPYYKDIVNNNLSELININQREPKYTATYYKDTVPRDSYTFNFYSDELIAFSPHSEKGKEALEAILISKKYNL